MVRIMGLFLVFVLSCAAAEGFDPNQIPDFQDGNWVFSSEAPLNAPFTGRVTVFRDKNGRIIGVGHENDAWGRGINWILKPNGGIAGTESFAYKEKTSFRKEWGKVTSNVTVAIRDRYGVWHIQPEGFPKLLPEIREGKLIGVGVWFKTPKGSSELYFPDPDYRK